MKNYPWTYDDKIANNCGFETMSDHMEYMSRNDQQEDTRQETEEEPETADNSASMQNAQLALEL